MGATATKRSLAEFIESIKHDMCILPSSVFTELLQRKDERETQLIKILERIAVSLETEETETKRHNKVVEEKIDDIIRVQNNIYGTLEKKFICVICS